MKRFIILLLCVIGCFALTQFTIAEQQTQRTLQLTLQNSQGKKLEIDVQDIQEPAKLYRFDIAPVGLERIQSTIDTLFGEEAQMLVEKEVDGSPLYLLPDPQGKPGTLGAFASFSYFFGDNSISYIDYRRDLNGGEVEGINAPNCALTFEQADEKCQNFLERLGMEAPFLIAGGPRVASGKETKGFYFFQYTSAFDGISFTRSTMCTGANDTMYPFASIYISDEGIFSVGGNFQYERRNVEPIEDFVSLDELIERLQFYLESGLFDKMPPLPISSISLEMISAPKSDGSFSVRPVWVVQTDRRAVKFEWQQAGLFGLNLKIYADDGSIASM